MKSELIYPESFEKKKDEVLKKMREKGEEFIAKNLRKLEELKKSREKQKPPLL